jgi:hypothetical protein
LAPALALSQALAGCTEGPLLQTEEYVTKPGEAELYMGGSCLGVDNGSAAGGATAPGAFGAAGAATAELGYQYGYEARGKVVRFNVTDYDGQVLVERSYDAVFLASGRRDDVTLDVFGHTLRFVHRGVPRCEPVREP